ncbi:MAG TPA: DUF3791 domain-containing protein [Candidatus Megamonas gallistercoris]|nr:DUF3791 domain-containing protein [Candidatus Megamonas gallistercoris]
MIKNKNELEFVIFCIENIAIRLGISAEKIYDIFTKKSDILSDYIVANYEALHTQDKEYIIDDILSVMKVKGIKI